MAIWRRSNPGNTGGTATASAPATTAPHATPLREAVPANYQYWRLAGGQWAAEYDQRKRRQPKYHIQELMLTRYVERCAGSGVGSGGAANDGAKATTRVLEYGCGVGRHLRNLARLPGVEPFGYDQSSTMVQHIGAWAGEMFGSLDAGRAWVDGHVRLGPPVPTLPWADGYFALAYSSEVLVHVRPEDLDRILSELLRVSGGHVLHLEPSPGVIVDRLSHDGCWNHDLIAAYARLGVRCEALPVCYDTHTPYRVWARGGPAPGAWSDVEAALWRRLESDINAGFEIVERALRGER